MTNKEQAIEKIALLLINETSTDYLGRARAIIALLESLGYVQLDPNQDLPDTTYLWSELKIYRRG